MRREKRRDLLKQNPNGKLAVDNTGEGLLQNFICRFICYLRFGFALSLC